MHTSYGVRFVYDDREGMMNKCTDCGRVSATLTPCEGRRLCPPCVSAYLTDASQTFNANHYGEQYRYARGNALPVTPKGRW
jgi:hypothetical protein